MAMAVLEPAPQPARDDGQHGVVDRRAVGGPRHRPQSIEFDRGERDRPARVDVPVERRAMPRVRSLACRRSEPSEPVLYDRAHALRGLLRARRSRLLVPQRGVGHAHRRGPIGERMVNAPYQRAAASGQARDDVYSPQRPGAVQPLLEDARHGGSEPGHIERLASAGEHHVLVEIEIRIQHPGRRPVDVGEAHPQRERPVEAGGDRCSQRPGVDPIPQHDHLARVPRDGLGLQPEDGQILDRERPHHLGGRRTVGPRRRARHIAADLIARWLIF